MISSRSVASWCWRRGKSDASLPEFLRGGTWYLLLLVTAQAPRSWHRVWWLHIRGRDGRVCAETFGDVLRRGGVVCVDDDIAAERWVARARVECAKCHAQLTCGGLELWKTSDFGVAGTRVDQLGVDLNGDA